MHALLVDDERLARDELWRLLRLHRDVTVVGEAANADEAEARPSTLPIDLLFLDIKMPSHRVFLRDGARCWIVALAEIAFFEAEGNDARVNFGQNRPLIRSSLNTLEARLDPTLSFRVSRQHQPAVCLKASNPMSTTATGCASEKDTCCQSRDGNRVSRDRAWARRPLRSFQPRELSRIDPRGTAAGDVVARHRCIPPCAAIARSACARASGSQS